MGSQPVSDKTSWFEINKDNLTLRLYVQPGAKRNEVTGLHGEALKIRLNAPPVEGKANEALKSFIAELFQVPLRQVELKRGDKSRHKVLVIHGSIVKPEQLLTL